MSQENVEIVKGLLATFRERDFEAAIPYMHPEIEMRPALVGGPEGVIYRGLDGARRFWAEVDLAWTKFRIEATEFRDLDDRVLVLGYAHAHGRESGIALTAPAAWLAEIRDGRIRQWQSFANQRDGLEAAGLQE